MYNFTVEEPNLLSIYKAENKAARIAAVTAAMPYMNGGMRELVKRSIEKLAALSEKEYAELSFSLADDL